MKQNLFRIVLAQGRQIIIGLVLLGFVAVFLIPAISTSWRGSAALIQFVPALRSLLAGLLVPGLPVLLVLIGLTFLFGRIYCSFLCPFGILQEIIWRLPLIYSHKRRSAQRLGSRTSHIRRWVLVMVVLSLIFGIGLPLVLLDPYSQFGRLMILLSDPVRVVTEASGFVTCAALFSLAFLATSLKWGRLFCNVVCPVGEILSRIARISLFRVQRDSTSCIKCGHCLSVCSAKAIDLKNGKIASDRCISCFRCVSVCSRGGLHLGFSRSDRKTRKTNTESRSHSSILCLTDMKTSDHQGLSLPGTSRRTFLCTSAAGLLSFLHVGTDRKATQHVRAVAPPGSRSIEHFLSSCTACQLCVRSCPTGTLRPSSLEYGWAGMMMPHLDFSDAGCEISCTACSEVCPSGAILAITPSEKQRTRIGIAVYDKKRCRAVCAQAVCGKCIEYCPTHAWTMRSSRLPVWDENFCSQCWVCVEVCPAHALSAQQIPGKKRKKIVVNPQICVGCGSCVQECESEALEMKVAGLGKLSIPVLDEARCIGCGKCEASCPGDAIHIRSLEEHQLI